MAKLKDALIEAGAIEGPTEAQLKAAAVNFKAELPDPKLVRYLPLSALHPSEKNLRKKFEGIEELAASIKAMGLISTLTVRPRPTTGFEIIAGGRRYLAAKRAGLKEVPVDVREFTDSQVAEIMLVENSQREDLHPLEEAEGYDRLRFDHHYSVPQIAAKVGKSVGWVHARRKLLALGPEARKAFYVGAIDATVAVPLARISSHKLQVEALRKIAPKDGEKMSSRAAIEWLTKEFTHTLKAAPFDQKAKDLVPEVRDGRGQLLHGGPCGKCPARSGSTPGLFEDISGHDTCTHTPCFDAKSSAAWKLTSASAEAKGMTVLSLAKGRAIFAHNNEIAWDSEYVLADSPCSKDPKKRTYRQLAAKVEAEKRPPLFFIPDQKLKGRECFKSAAVLELVKDQKWAAKELTLANNGTPESNENFEKERKDIAARGLALEELADAAGRKHEFAGVAELRLIALSVHRNGGIAREQAEKRRDLDDKTSEDWIAKKADSKQLFRYVYEVAIGEYVGTGWQGFTEEAELLAKIVGFDLKEATKVKLTVVVADALMKKPEAIQPGATQDEGDF